MADTPMIYQALSDVMNTVREVRKGERNGHFNFMFRGIDAVTNAVGPALREHGVAVVPVDMHAEYVTVPTNRGQSTNVRVRNTYRWVATDGSYVDTVATGESMDTGDKGTAKANSVAFRTCMLQTLCLPTDDRDPDHYAYEQQRPNQGKQPSQEQQRQAYEQARKLFEQETAAQPTEKLKQGLDYYRKAQNDDKVSVIEAELAKRENAAAQNQAAQETLQQELGAQVVEGEVVTDRAAV